MPCQRQPALLFLFDTGATSMVINSNSLEGIPMEFNETIVNYGATGFQ